MSKKLLHRILTSSWFSVIVLAILIGALAMVARSITKSYQVEPDFGGMVTIRQSEIDVNSTSSEHIILSQNMIYTYITDEKNLMPVAARFGWDIPYEKMVKQIDVQQKVTAKNSFVISVNTGSMERSGKVARALVVNFIESYRRQWEKMNRKNLVSCQQQIVAFEKEIKELQQVQQKLQKKITLNPVKNEIEIRAINEQLIAAQQQFFTTYCEFMNKLSDKYNEIELELELALGSYTEHDPKVKKLKAALAAMQKRVDAFQAEMNRQNPDIYSMKVKIDKLENLPPHLMFLYDNIQRLQQLKLSLLLPSIIQDKEQRLEAEQRKKLTLEHLLNSKSCDVFIRESGR